MNDACVSSCSEKEAGCSCWNMMIWNLDGAIAWTVVQNKTMVWRSFVMFLQKPKHFDFLNVLQGDTEIFFQDNKNLRSNFLYVKICFVCLIKKIE